VRGIEFAKVVDGDLPDDFQDGRSTTHYFVTQLSGLAVAVAAAVVAGVVGM